MIELISLSILCMFSGACDIYDDYIIPNIQNECEIKTLNYLIDCSGPDYEAMRNTGDIYIGFNYHTITHDLVYQSCTDDKSESYCVIMNNNVQFCGEYNATRSWVKDNTCRYNDVDCYIVNYNTGYYEEPLDLDFYKIFNYDYVINEINLHDIKEQPQYPVLCYDRKVKIFDEPIDTMMNIIQQNKNKTEFIVNQNTKECGIRTDSYNVFYKQEPDKLPYVLKFKEIPYELKNYINYVTYNSCERDIYPIKHNGYCIIINDHNHFCGEYQAVKTWIDQNPINCKQQGDCFIYNRYINYYENILYGMQYDLPDIFRNCINGTIGNYTNDFNIMDDELFTIFRINEDITMRISNLDIDNTQENHTMTFTFHNDWGTRTLDVPFTPKDGKYQFIESIDFFDQVKNLRVHRNAPMFVQYNDQCSVTEFFLDWKKP